MMTQTIFSSVSTVSNRRHVRRNISVRACAKQVLTPPPTTCPKRREAVFLGSFGLQLSIATNARALIPANDDDDEELLAKAKAGRAERIQAERALEKKYVAKNELKFDSDTSRVQVAVYKLSKAGSLIESGYLALAAEELGRGSWEEDLQVAGDNLGYQPQSFIKNVAELRRACMAGEVDKAKSAYVASARSLEEYALASNVAGYLKLL